MQNILIWLWMQIDPRFFLCYHYSINKYLHSSNYTRRLYTVYTLRSSLDGSRSNWKKLNCKIGRIRTVWNNIQIENDAIQPIYHSNFSIQPVTFCSVYTIIPGRIETWSFLKFGRLPKRRFTRDCTYLS